MAKKGSLLTKLLMKNQDIVYDSGWTTHSNSLGMWIAERLAFTPGSWTVEENRAMYKPHSTTPATRLDEMLSDEDFIAARWEQPEGMRIFEEWERDYASTYVIHSFNPDRDGEGVLANFTGITPGYVLARQSNFARAVYPVVWHALDAGLFKMEGGVAVATG